jgi:hypothetical protein
VALPRMPSLEEPRTGNLKPVRLTAAQDHARILNQLHIKSLRPGVNGGDAPNAANYDEARANPYPDLPDPLKLDNGTPVITTDMWWQQRRRELEDAFEHQIYGGLQDGALGLNWSVTDSVPDRIGGLAVTTRHVVAHLASGTNPPVAIEVHLMVSVPVGAKGPVPLILQLLPGNPKTPQPSSTWREQVLAKGWGIAVLDVTSVQPDDGADLTRGAIGVASNGQPRDLLAWGTLRAWAWGASRAMDYFENDAAIDSTQVGIMGHSRYGKAALIAMAFDPRFAVAFISSSGAGGAALLRRNFGERLENLASESEYHWFGSNFLKYAGPLTAKDLPVDAHELIALCAPRPVFISSGSLQVEGGWIDAKGMFLGGVGAGPVYRLLGKKDLGTSEMPPQETALIGGDIAFRQHSFGHTAGPNWPTFLEFAGRYIKLANAPPATGTSK